MCDRGFGCIIVVDDDQHVTGILTERDIMTRVVNEHKDAEKIKVGDVRPTITGVMPKTERPCIRPVRPATASKVKATRA